MFREKRVTRRRMLRRSAAAFAGGQFLPGSLLGKDGAVPPSERINLGGIGIGGRGGQVLRHFLDEPDCRVVAVADVRVERREAVKKMVDDGYQNSECRMYRDFRHLLDRQDVDAVLIATQRNWHGLASIYSAKAGKDVYCEKPCTNTIAESIALKETFRRTARLFQAGTQRRTVPHNVFAVELARRGRLGKLTAVHAAGDGSGRNVGMSGWTRQPAPEPDREVFDWDLFLGPAPWRPCPGRDSRGHYPAGDSSLIGHGVLEWGSHTVDLCQWANDADATVPIEYLGPPSRGEAMYANGCRLVVRREGWLGLGSCPVRFEGETGWVEVGDSGKIVVSSPELFEGKDLPDTSGFSAHWHVRNFLDCIKTREQPAASAEAAGNAHIACHAVNIALFLNRGLKYDPVKNEFLGDEEANRLRGTALRDPWHF